MLIAVGLAPELDKLSKQFNSFLVDNKDSIVSGIGKFAKGLTEVMALLWRMKVPLMAIGAIIAVSIAPEIIAITAAVTALALLVDDLSMPMRGGESVVANKSLEVMHTINKPVDSMLGFMKNMFNGGGKVEQNVVVEVKSTDPERSAIEVRDKLQEHLEIAKALVQGGGM